MEKGQKRAEDYNCSHCYFKCSKLYNWNRHILTAKHQFQSNSIETGSFSIEKGQKRASLCDAHVCVNCLKKYKSSNSLWYHSKKCSGKPTRSVVATNSPQVSINGETVLEFIKQNQELKNLLYVQNEKIIEQNEKLMEQNEKLVVLSTKTGVVTTNKINKTNITNNNQFNLNFFLNETCKDAININDFIQNIDVQLKELENVGTGGYVSGITNIILSRLNQLDISKRPLHCTDIKRETMYVKEENEWNKDSDDKTKIKRMIKMVANKNCNKVPEWQEQNPNSLNNEHQLYESYIQIARNSLGDVGDEQIRLDEKIVKNIAKHVIIDKTI